MRRKLTYRIGICIVVLVVCVIGYWFSTRQTDNSLRIGAVIDLTGAAGVYGENVKDGMDLAVKVVNEADGVNGRQVSLIYADTMSEAKGAALAAQRVIAQKVPAIVGAVASTTTMTIAPIAQRAGVVLVSPTASNPEIPRIGDLIFRVWPSDTFEGSEMARFARQQLGAATACILYINNDYGLGLAEVFAETFTAGGGVVALSEPLDEQSTDFRTELAKVRRANPDVVYIPGYTKELGLALRQYRELGITAQILSTATFEAPTLIADAGPAAEGVIYTAPAFSVDSEKEHVRNYVRAFEAEYGHQPDTIASHGYDAVMIVVEAIRRGGTAPEGIRDALLGMQDYPGVTGAISFEATGDVLKGIEFKTVSDGQFMKYAPEQQELAAVA
ncbi:MAG: ABC transporter substrate-binding protein [Acidimicrobiales bacterium]